MFNYEENDPMKTDLVQEFPGNNPSHIFNSFDILVFRLTPC